MQISARFFKFENMSSSHPQTSLCCTSNLWFHNVVTLLLKEWICLCCRLFGLVRLLCIPQAPSSLPLTITSFLFFLPSNFNSVIPIVPQPGHVGIITLLSLFFYLLFYVSQRSRDLASIKRQKGWLASGFIYWQQLTFLRVNVFWLTGCELKWRRGR